MRFVIVFGCVGFVLWWWCFVWEVVYRSGSVVRFLLFYCFDWFRGLFVVSLLFEKGLRYVVVGIVEGN